MDRDYAMAHGLARLALGINIAMHGITRIPKFDAFAAYLGKQFAASPLPSEMVRVSAYMIVAAETIVGILLLLGLFTRTALIAGSVTMLVLLFGTCLVWNWDAAGAQMVYVAFFTGLLATVKNNHYSLDAWCRQVPARNS